VVGVGKSDAAAFDRPSIASTPGRIAAIDGLDQRPEDPSIEASIGTAADAAAAAAAAAAAEWVQREDAWTGEPRVDTVRQTGLRNRLLQKAVDRNGRDRQRKI